MKERMVLVCGKYKLYRLQVDISALTIGLTLFLTKRYYCSKPALKIVSENLHLPKERFKKYLAESLILDYDKYLQLCPNSWILLRDYAYIDCLELFRASRSQIKPQKVVWLFLGKHEIVSFHVTVVIKIFWDIAIDFVSTVKQVWVRPQYVQHVLRVSHQFCKSARAMAPASSR